MARENNFLIGNGEKITKGVSVPNNSRPKNPPYTLFEAQERLSDNISDAQDYFEQLSDKAKPKNQVVAKLTMHPRYISKSDYPKDMLDFLGLRAIGSKSERIIPSKWGVKKHPSSALTESYFIAGPERNFNQWYKFLETGNISDSLENIVTIEKFAAINGAEKFKGLIDDEQHHFEIVLHNDDDKEIIESFLDYAMGIGGDVQLKRIRTVDGLTFVPITVDSINKVNEISDFSFVRLARSMPSLRPLMIRGVDLHDSALILPANQITDQTIKTVIFDGGLANPSELSNWVNYIEPIGIGKPTTGYLNHGLAVTGAYLFGHINKNKDLPIPITKVDHVRVLDEDSGRFDYEIVDVLDRIKNHLESNEYDFVNISLGPDISVDDDDVTLWTATLDKIFSKGTSIATVAIGNNGERDAISGLNRIQVPSDAVNVLSVGASNITGADWKKADYSAFGPGRCPGKVKPDFIVFGGSKEEPFEVLQTTNNGLVCSKNCGTSFSAPLALRSIAGLRSTLGSNVTNLALRALMVHEAEKSTHKLHEVGWGRAELEPLKLITTEDYEATVLYQGELLVGEHLRIPVPIQNLLLKGDVNLKATLVISPDIDIEFPGSYTRHGIQVVFRPNDTVFKIDKTTGKKPEHAQSEPFFTKSELFKSPEFESRSEGNKWEPTLKHQNKWKAHKLSNPVFDVYYHYRESATTAKEQKPIPYAMIITISAQDVPDLYNQVIRNYATILTAYRPQNRIQLSNRN
ncbi:S8 family peptidase [Acinetobacter bereziniae]|uniref:S8 family peptidase n=1 Tax=Acinetobacter bereziniae TaxID=106648 RepID=UPI0012502F59|nr:S8 family peptidase [Acinetobacter bereziniae]